MTTTQKQQPAVSPVQGERGGRPSLASLAARGADADRRIARVLPGATAPGARTVTFNSSL
ncbi:hypothetical protein ACFWBN_36305 [Streptomyces sp. NPDC059989]|uniref:hypothetical protein n=1 Tax=Streptomyces sp. NPDC059989 TaxID=3347026 RepID=UPI00369BA5BA